MKGRFVITAFVLVTFIACSKQDIQVRSLQKTSLVQQTKPQVFSTGWETVSSWNAEKGEDAVTLSYTRTLPQLKSEVLSDGLVLVFVRNLWEDHEELKESDIHNTPLMMPFYFLPYFEKPGYTEQWTYSLNENKISISLIVKGSEKPTVPKRIQLRYVVIPPELLREKGQPAQAVRKLSYNQLMQSFGLDS